MGGEFNEHFDRLRDISLLEEILLELEVKEDLAHDNLKREVKHLITKLLVLKREILLEDLSQELGELRRGEVMQMTLHILGAFKDTRQEVLEDHEVLLIELRRKFDQRVDQCFDALFHPLLIFSGNLLTPRDHSHVL
jgi:hypothetical protein